MDLLVSGNAVGKHVERLLPRHACAAFDLPRHPGVGGHHRQRVVRPAVRWHSPHTARAGAGLRYEGGFGKKAKPLENFCPGTPFEPSFNPLRGLLLCSTIR